MNCCTLYHVTTSGNDRDNNYFAIGDTHRLIPVISPSDATDKSVSWSIINESISKINSEGVLHAWNLGETLAYVTTSNNVKSRVTVEVVRDATIVHTTQVTIIPSTITFDVVNDIGIYKEAHANVSPVYSSYNVVSWTADIDAEKIIMLESLGNNHARVKLNDKMAR